MHLFLVAWTDNSQEFSPISLCAVHGYTPNVLLLLLLLLISFFKKSFYVSCE